MIDLYSGYSWQGAAKAQNGENAAAFVEKVIDSIEERFGRFPAKASYHAVQNNPTVREVEKGVANFGVNTLARAGEGLVDAAADTASFVIGQPEIAAAADAGEGDATGARTRDALQG